MTTTPLTLAKIPGMGTGTEQAPTTPRTTTRRPWYPLVGHRQGLRRNDLTTLASALWLLALEGGTAHLGKELYDQRCDATPGTDGPCFCPVH